MILGDSLQVMASLAEREGLRGKVQCIPYMTRPTASSSTPIFSGPTSRDVKDGNAGHITREPQVRGVCPFTYVAGWDSFVSDAGYNIMRKPKTG